MKPISVRNHVYVGSNQRQSVYDLVIPESFNGVLILFIHGYKGYKDWGAWNLVQKEFTELGYGFCKFNLTHNGGTVEHPMDFPDLDAFANNRYSYELFDVECIIELLSEQVSQAQIVLMGHSRGGAIAMLCSQHPKVKAIITLAAISSIQERFPQEDKLTQWRVNGVRYEKNTRTQQLMPINFTYYTDYLENKERLDIQSYSQKNKLPVLHFHGSQDEAVLLEEGLRLASWTKGKLIILEDSNHTFETTHPWNQRILTQSLQQIVEKSNIFLENSLIFT